MVEIRQFDDVEYREPATTEALEALEKHLGVRFPESYRMFMMASDGAAFMEENHRFVAVFATGETTPRLEWVYPMEQMQSQNGIWRDEGIYDEDEPLLAEGMIVIGDAVDDTDQGPILLDLRPDAPRKGAVYFRHQTFSATLAGVNWFEALAYVAPSFEAFLDALNVIEE